MGKNNLIPKCSPMSKFVYFLLFTFINLSFNIAPVFSQVHIKERVEIIPHPDMEIKQTQEFIDQLNGLFISSSGNTVIRSGLESLSSIQIPLIGKEVFLSYVLFIKEEVSLNEPPSGSTGFDDLNFTVDIQSGPYQNDFTINCDTITHELISEYKGILNCAWQHLIVNKGNYKQGVNPLFPLGDICFTDIVNIEFNNYIDNNWYKEWAPGENVDWNILEQYYGITLEYPVGLLFTFNIESYGLICGGDQGMLQRGAYLIFEEGAPEQYLQIGINKENLSQGDSAKINITAFDTLGNVFSVDPDTPVQLSIAPSGTFTNGDTLIELTYSEVNEDSLTFYAPESLPDGIDSMEIEIIARLQDCSNIKGSENISVIKKEKIEIQITSPDPILNRILRISNTPQMPIETFKAQISGYNLTGSEIANWECRVAYDYPIDPRHSSPSAEVVFTEELTFDTNQISEWVMNFNNSAIIIGGEVTITVNTTLNGQNYTDNVVVYIRGENPENNVVLAGTDNGEQTLFEVETDGFNQFRNEAYADPGEGLPLRSDADGQGWGLGQIDSRHHNITIAILWDWTANKEYALNLYNNVRNAGEARLEATGYLDTPAEGQTRQSMIDSEGYADYNGRYGRYWEWQDATRTNPIAQWIAHPTSIPWGDSEDNRTPNPGLGRNVARYLRNY